MRGVIRSGRARDLLAVAGLVLLTVVVFEGHVRRGFFIADDWFYDAVSRFGGHTMGLSSDSRLGAFFDIFPDRPTLPFVFAATHGLFGLHMKLHFAASVGAGFLMAAAFYALLRTLEVERIHSFAIAALALLFPFADAPRLWATGIQVSLAVIVFLLGLTLALLGLRARGRRSVALHVAAVALYLLSVLTYQLTLGLVLASGVVYLFNAPRRTALVRWAADVVIVLPVAWIVGSSAPKPTSGLASDRLNQIYHTALKLLPAAASPKQASIGSTWLTVAILAVPAVAAVVAWRIKGDVELRRWTVIAGVSLLMAAAGYLALFPAQGYNALDVGIGNRVNLAASLGMVTLVYADLVLVSLLLMRGPLRPLRFVPVLIVAVLIGLGYHDLLDRHERDYRTAIAGERAVVGAMTTVHAPPPKDATLYVVGHPFFINGVPIFSRTSDTRAAAKIYLDPTFQAAPMAGLAKLVCRAHDVYPPAWGIGVRAPYGRAIVVDVGSGRATTITSRSACLRGGFPLTTVPG